MPIYPRVAASILSVLCLGLTPGCGGDLAEAPKPTTEVKGVVGLWESVDVTRGGIGNYMEFRADGSLVSGLCAMVDMGYSLEGDRLSLVPPEGQSDEVPSLRLEFADAEMIVRPWNETGTGGAVAQIVRKRRLTPHVEGSAPIVGDWVYTHYTSAQAYERYTAAGRMLLRVPMATKLGAARYRVMGSVLELTQAGSEPTRLAFIREGEELRVTPEGKPQRSYRVVPGGAWYAPPDAATLQRMLEAANAAGVAPK